MHSLAYIRVYEKERERKKNKRRELNKKIEIGLFNILEFLINTTLTFLSFKLPRKDDKIANFIECLFKYFLCLNKYSVLIGTKGTYLCFSEKYFSFTIYYFYNENLFKM